MRLLLARHGQSRWQIAGDAAGSDAPLTPLGELQAHRLGVYLQRDGDGLRIARVVASDLQRARRTAEIVASYLALPVELAPGLQEFEGWPVGWAPKPAAMWDPRPDAPLAAPYLTFRERVVEVVRRAIAQEGTPLIVAHGGTISAFLRFLTGCDTPRFAIANAALQIVSWKDDAWMFEALNLQDYLPLPLRSI